MHRPRELPLSPRAPIPHWPLVFGCAKMRLPESESMECARSLHDQPDRNLPDGGVGRRRSVNAHSKSHVLFPCQGRSAEANLF
eukprot:scaffold260_cov328-Prasinococcus_capsulatus_cf.AAC.24